MDNKLLENIAFQEHEEWKRDILAILNDEPRWFVVKDANSVASLDAQFGSKTAFVPSVYRKVNDNWEVDVLHANYYQLPGDYKETCLGIAEKAVSVLQNFGEGLGRDERIVRCYKNALTMLNATDKQFEGSLADFIKDFRKEQAEGNNVFYRLNDACVFTKFDTVETIYAKVYGMSQKDKAKYDKFYASNSVNRKKRLQENGEISIEEIIARGKKVIPQSLHSEWSKSVVEYLEDYNNLQASFGWDKGVDKKTMESGAKRSLLKVIQLIDALNKGKDIKTVTPRIENIYELSMIVKFVKNGEELANKIGYARKDKLKVNKVYGSTKSSHDEDIENQ